jgi:hypothetical protein
MLMGHAYFALLGIINQAFQAGFTERRELCFFLAWKHRIYFVTTIILLRYKALKGALADLRKGPRSGSCR